MPEYKAPSVSYLVSAHNAERTIRASINSLLQQRFDSFEVVVVNDGSTDSTADILANIRNMDMRLSLVTLPRNVGLTRALNIGLTHCNGTYVARHDADDISLPERTMLQWNYAIAVDAKFLCSKFLTGSRVSPKYFRRKVTLRSLRYGNFLCHGTFFMRRDMLRDIGGYSEEWPVSQDFELVLRALGRGIEVHFHPVPVYELSRDCESISTRKRDSQRELARRALRLHASDCDYVDSPRIHQKLMRAVGI